MDVIFFPRWYLPTNVAREIMSLEDCMTLLKTLTRDRRTLQEVCLRMGTREVVQVFCSFGSFYRILQFFQYAWRLSAPNCGSSWVPKRPPRGQNSVQNQRKTVPEPARGRFWTCLAAEGWQASLFNRFLIFLAIFRRFWDPNGGQNRRKIDPKSIQISRCVLDVILSPKSSKKRFQIDPKDLPNKPPNRLKSGPSFFIVFSSLF